nr:hypothetical protein [uncultured Prevotella sp.]
MKKILFMIACCLMATAQTIFAQDNYSGKVFLQHKGNITAMYGGGEIDKAIEAAVDGDTLFLSKGRFNSKFTINKSISLIGSGAETEYDERRSTFIEWNNSPRINAGDGKIISSVTIEGISCGSSFYVEGKIENLELKKCYFSNTLGISNSSNNGYTKKVTIDRCRLNDFSTDGSIADATIKNCKISNAYGQGGQNNSSCKFINCNIRRVNINTKAMFVNSIINEVGNGTDDYLGNNAILVNTLYHNMNGYDPMEKTSLQDCWATTETVISSNNGDLECPMTVEQRQAAGYLGVDGTVVGIEGGVNPYSLTLHAPSINSSSANVDLNNKKVTINVNVTAN